VASVRCFLLAEGAYLTNERKHRSSKAFVHMAQQEGEVTIDSMGSSHADAIEFVVSVSTRSSTRDGLRAL
jgi:hypothetical protein